MKTKIISRVTKPRFVVDAIEQRVLLAPVCIWNGTVDSSWDNAANWSANLDTTPAACTRGGAHFTYVFSGPFINQPDLNVDVYASELHFFGDCAIEMTGFGVITLTADTGIIKFGQATVDSAIAHTVAPDIAISGSGATIVHYTKTANANTTLTLNGAVTGRDVPVHVTSVDGELTPAATGGFVIFGSASNTFGNLTVDNLAGSLGNSLVGGKVKAKPGTAITIDQNWRTSYLGQGAIALNKGTLNLFSTGTLTWSSGTLTAENGSTFSATSTDDVVLEGGKMTFSGANTIGSIIANGALSVPGDFRLTEKEAASVTLITVGNLTWTAGRLIASHGSTFSAMSTAADVVLKGGQMTFAEANTTGSITANGTLSVPGNFTLIELAAAKVTLNTAGNLRWTAGILTAANGSTFTATSTAADVVLEGGEMNFFDAGTTVSIIANRVLTDASTFTLNAVQGPVVTFKSGTSTTLNGNHNVNGSTLTLESSAAFVTSTPVTTGGIKLTAGTLKFVAAANINNALGLPILSLGAGASTIDFSGIRANAASNTTAITATFRDSSAATWDGTLGINAWSSNPHTALLFGTNNNGLTPTQINKINSWANIQNVAGITSGVGSRIDSAGEVIPLLSLSPTYAAALVAINTYLGCYPSTKIASNGQYPWICTGVCGGGIPAANCPDAAAAPGVASIHCPVAAVYAATPAGGLTGPAAAEALFNMITQSFEGSNFA
jgi:hypothetical protein